MMNIKDCVVEINGCFWPKIATDKFHLYDETLGMLNAISPYLRGTDTIIQAGGNCGVTVKQFVDTFKTVYTFEPDAVNFYCLNLNLPYKNVIKFQSCLGKERKLTSIENDLPDDNGAGFVSLQKTSSDTIPVLTIDDLNLESCNAIVLDVEGFEYNVLLGATHTIKKFKPVLCLEITIPWMERYSITKEMLDNLLGELGYHPVRVYYTSFSTDVIYVPDE